MLTSLVPCNHPQDDSLENMLEGLAAPPQTETGKTMNGTSVVLPVFVMVSRLLPPRPSSSFLCGVTQDRTGKDYAQSSVHRPVGLAVAHCFFSTAWMHICK